MRAWNDSRIAHWQDSDRESVDHYATARQHRIDAGGGGGGGGGRGSHNQITWVHWEEEQRVVGREREIECCIVDDCCMLNRRLGYISQPGECVLLFLSPFSPPSRCG